MMSLMSSARVVARLSVLVALLCSPVVGQQFEIHKLALNPEADDELGYSVVLGDDQAMVGARYDKSNGVATGVLHIFAPNDNEWPLAQDLVSSDAIVWDRFGGAVATSGAWLIVGAFGDDDAGNWTGSAYLYHYDGAGWTDEHKITAADRAADDQFGYSVAMDGDYAVIGSLGDDDGGARSGSAYIFIRSDSTWTQQAKLVASDDAAGDEFGTCVAIDGSFAVIGAPLKDSSAGAAYIFERTGEQWVQVAKITANGASADDRFGASVAIAEDVIIVGAPGRDSGRGAVLLFEHGATDWTQTGTFVPADVSTDDAFGSAVAMIPGQFVAGSIGYDGERGAVYRFDRLGAGWLESAQFVASDAAAGDSLGNSVSISPTLVLAGAVGDDASAGAAYLFANEFLDCDTSGIPDVCDVNCSLTNPLTGELCWIDYPTTCGAAVDCNANGMPDTCEPDCNHNGLADDCDIAGASFDCNANGVPDECEPDCNSNGVADDCDIDAGQSTDCDSNGVPDECQLSESVVLLDADFETALPAGWDASGLWHATSACAVSGACDPSSWAYFGLDAGCTFDTGAATSGVLTAPSVDVPAGVETAILTYCSIYEGEGGAAPNGLDAAWVAINGQVRDSVSSTAPSGQWETRSIDLTAYAGQNVTIAWHFNSRDGALNDTLGWQIDAVRLVAGDAYDNDCNDNGQLDSCDLADGVSADCNSNSVPDECDLAGGSSGDCNTNGIPDDCESTADCDTNGIPDICDLVVIYVDADATGQADGSSWTDAFGDLQAAIDHANTICVPTEIWVAQGTYAPAGPGGARTASFIVLDQTAIYGGFAGTESKRYQRNTDPAGNGTVLTGDLNGDDNGSANRGENSYHVVTASGAGPTAVLDGFTVTAGNANDASPNDRGPALFIDVGAPTVRNCIFANHTGQGGAVYIRAAAPTIEACTFHDNSAAFGGAVFTYVNSAPFFNRCIFRKNNATNSGGAAYTASAAAPVFANSIFTGNTATNDGAALYASGADPELINCTLSQNHAGRNGGGVAAVFVSLPVLANTILWNNTDSGGADETAQLYLDTTSLAAIGYTCMQGLSGPLDAGNINVDPLFVDADGPDDVAGTADDDLRLAAGSPCIDAAANDDAVVSGAALDVAGLPRFVDDEATADTGEGDPPLIDMGAREYQTDCNHNGVADPTDIAAGTSADCDDNDVPDECELSEHDCNQNGTLDACDILAGTTSDCSQDGVPDECEADCDSNGTPDVCDIAAGQLTDCDSNGVPDECELAGHDCNTNGVLDGCELFADIFAASGPLTPVAGGEELAFTIDTPPVAMTDVTLTFRAVADLSAASEYIDVRINQVSVGTVFSNDAHDCPAIADEDELVVAALTFNAALAGNDAVIALLPSDNVDAICATSIEVEVSYRAFEDCDGDQAPDVCAPDCNTNGSPDACDLAGGISADCNSNGVPDECDIAAATSTDVNTNAMPDECEGDCNANGVPDEIDLATGVSADRNGNGTPDECETDCNANGVPDDVDITQGTSTDINSNAVPDDCEDCNENGILDEAEIAAGSSPDCNQNATLDVCEIDQNTPGGVYFCVSNCDPDCNADGVPDACELDPDCNTNGIPDVCDLVEDCNANDIPDECEVDSDGDGMINGCDGCPNDPAKVTPGICGCGVSDSPDGDADGVPDCIDLCPQTPPEDGVDADGCSQGACCFAIGQCDVFEPADCVFFGGSYNGGGTTCATDSDSDGLADCSELCPDDPNKTEPGDCGCGVSDVDTDDDGVADCLDWCGDTAFGETVDSNGCPTHGGCCTPTGACNDLLFVDQQYCDGQGGFYQGNGSRCADGCALGTDGDFNGDAIVNQLDYVRFSACLSGPREGALDQVPPPQCRTVFDFDQDMDVDLADFAAFMQRFGS